MLYFSTKKFQKSMEPAAADLSEGEEGHALMPSRTTQKPKQRSPFSVIYIGGILLIVLLQLFIISKISKHEKASVGISPSGNTRAEEYLYPDLNREFKATSIYCMARSPFSHPAAS